MFSSLFVVSTLDSVRGKVGHGLTEVKNEAALCWCPAGASVEAHGVSRKLVAEESLYTQVPV